MYKYLKIASLAPVHESTTAPSLKILNDGILVMEYSACSSEF